MKKWLSLVVMTCLLLGAAYLAVATEAGRNVLNSTAATRAMLAEIDALLAKDATNPELLAKRQEVVEVLQSAGETVEAVQSESYEKTPEYFRSIGLFEEAEAIEQQREAAKAEYLDALLSRWNEGATLSAVESNELLAAGMLPAEAQQAGVQDQDAALASYYDMLLERLNAGAQLSPSEKEELYASGLLDESRLGSDERGRLDDTGGPDGSGYRFVDNLAGDTATFAWIELCGDSLATELLTTDDSQFTITWGWNFPFYGGSYNSGFVNSNGQLRFVTGSTALTNADISATNTTPWISGFWDDLDPDGGGPAGSGCGGAGDNEVRWRDFGDKVVISWTNTPHFSESTDRYNFQIIIYPDGKIKLQYNTNWVNGTTGSTSSSIHIDGPLTDGVSYLHNGAPAGRVIDNTGRAIWFYQLFLDDDFACSSVLQPSPLRVSPGAALNIVGRFRNAGLNAQSSPISYQFNGGAIVTEATAILNTNQSEDHDFAGTETAPMAIGDYTLTLWSDLATDEDRTNDTVRVTVLVRDCYDEAQSNSFTDAGTTCGALNDWSATCLGTADGSEDYIYQWTTTTAGAWRFLLTAGTTTTRGLAVSSSCPPDSFNCLASRNQSQDTLFIDCLSLAAGTYYIMVDRSTGCDAYNLAVTRCPDNDFSCTAAVQPSPLRVAPGAVFNVVGRFQNKGQIAQSSPVAYSFNGGAVVNGSTGILTFNQTEDVDFLGTETAPVAIGDYPLTIYSNLASDEDRTNDTLRVTVLVRECYDEEAPNDAFSDTGTTCGALNDWSATCLGSADASEDYIYRWTTTTNGAWNLQLIATAAATRGLLVATACPPDSFNCVAFANIFQDTVSLNCVPLAAGTYYIMVDRSTGCDAYTLNVTPCTDIGRCCYNGGADCVDNGSFECQQLAGNWDRTTTCAVSPCPTFLDGGNTCAEAVALTIPATVRGNTVGAGDNDPGAQCALGSSDPYEGFNTAPDEWYTITGTGDSITVSLCSGYTAYDTQIAVFCSDDCANFTCVAGNDDATCTFSGLRSTARFCSELGRTYYVVVDGWGAGSGNFELIITLGAPCTTPVDCAPEGRCCYLDNGAPACVDNLSAECAALNGQWNDAASCATIPCPVGRCCYVDNGVGACETNTQLECNALGGTWNGTVTCESTPCPVARCCYDDNGTTACVNEIIEVCNTLSGVWTSGLTCEGAACPTILQGSDLCADAVMLPALNATYTGTTAGSTAETGIPTCGSGYNSTSIGVWYKLIGTGNTITIGLCDPITTWDTELFVFCNTCDTLLCVGGDDDFCASPVLASQLSFCSVLDAEYLVLVTAFGAGSGPYAMTVTDDGVTCVPVVQCPVLTVPCEPVVDLAVYVVTVGGFADHLQIHFTAPQDASYSIWTTTNPNNDGNPDNGADPDWTLLVALPNLLAGPQVYDAPAGFPLNYANAVVTADCTPAP